jgi:hypothetical protein
MEISDQFCAPAILSPRNYNFRHPLEKRLGGLQSRESNPAFQSVASRYANWVILLVPAFTWKDWGKV